MIQKRPDKTNHLNKPDSQNCSVCRDLLANLERFYSMLEAACASTMSDWLTVEEIATELKISKSIVYRLIHHGDLEAIDIVETNGEIAKKGHYRINRSSLNKYIESKKINKFPDYITHPPRPRRQPKVKNHLGL